MGLAGRDGCFAERVIVPIANLASVPKAISDEQAIFAEPLAAALHAARVVPVTNKTYVTVIGDSLVGLLASQVLARLNASVRLLGTNPERFTRCERWGVKHRHLDDVGRRQDQDVVLDATGDASGLGIALGLIRPRGKIVCHGPLVAFGYSRATDEIAPGLERIAGLEVEIQGARSGRVADAVECLLRGDVEVLSLLSKRFRFADMPAALLAVADPANVCVQAEI